MTTVQKALLELIKISVTEKCGTDSYLANCDWSELLKLASRQGCTCICWHAIEILHKNNVCTCPRNIKLQWYAGQQQITHKTQHLHAKAVAFADAMHPVRLTVLKGAHYASFWPNPWWREFGDLDCFAAEGDTALVDKRAAEIGCTVDDDDYKHSHIVYEGMMVENHHYFTGFAGSNEGHALEKELQELFKGAFTPLRQTKLLSPNPNFTALFLIAHAQNHFFYEGIYLRHILDWLFFLQKEGDHVDWNRVNGMLVQAKLKPFADLLTSFCVEYFGMKASANANYSKFLGSFANDLFAEKYDDFDRRPHKMVARMVNRYMRMYKFRKFLIMSVSKAIVRTLAFSSFLHRKPKLE